MEVVDMKGNMRSCRNILLHFNTVILSSYGPVLLITYL